MDALKVPATMFIAKLTAAFLALLVPGLTLGLASQGNLREASALADGN